MLICNHQLTESQLKDLEQLMQLSQMSESGIPSTYYHLLRQKRDAESNVLYYEHEQLIGFLSVYFFYQDACEISLLVLPSHRKQGIAKRLVATILPLLKAKEMKKLIFSSSVTPTTPWKPGPNFSYHQSEYHLERHSFETLLIANPRLSIRKATIGDIEVLGAIDVASFKEPQPNMVERFLYLLTNNEYQVLLAFYNDMPVGKAHIHWQVENTSLSDIAVLPEFQGQGLGSELLAYCVNQALSVGNINLALDVETKNQNALNLYLKNGFKIIHHFDYWSILAEEVYSKIQAT